MLRESARKVFESAEEHGESTAQGRAPTANTIYETLKGMFYIVAFSSSLTDIGSVIARCHWFIHQN